jgi:hypothetical protein
MKYKVLPKYKEILQNILNSDVHISLIVINPQKLFIDPCQILNYTFLTVIQVRFIFAHFLQKNCTKINFHCTRTRTIILTDLQTLSSTASAASLAVIAVGALIKIPQTE